MPVLVLVVSLILTLPALSSILLIVLTVSTVILTIIASLNTALILNSLLSVIVLIDTNALFAIKYRESAVVIEFNTGLLNILVNNSAILTLSDFSIILDSLKTSVFSKVSAATLNTCLYSNRLAFIWSKPRVNFPKVTSLADSADAVVNSAVVAAVAKLGVGVTDTNPG